MTYEVRDNKVFSGTCGCGAVHLIADFYKDGRLEGVSIKVGKSGSCIRAMSEALGDMINHNIKFVRGDRAETNKSIAGMVALLKDIRCPETKRVEMTDAPSCPEAFARLLRELLASMG